MTWPPCARSAGCSPVDPSDSDAASQNVAPRSDIGATAQQGTTFTFSHAAPDTPFDTVVQRFDQALGLDVAA